METAQRDHGSHSLLWGQSSGTQDKLFYLRLVSSRYWCLRESLPVHTLFPVKELPAKVACAGDNAFSQSKAGKEGIREEEGGLWLQKRTTQMTVIRTQCLTL